MSFHPVNLCMEFILLRYSVLFLESAYKEIFVISWIWQYEIAFVITFYLIKSESNNIFDYIYVNIYICVFQNQNILKKKKKPNKNSITYKYYLVGYLYKYMYTFLQVL